MEKSWTDESGVKAWEEMTQLLNRPYWRRVWIQQELHNNRKVLIHCGHKFAPLEWWPKVYNAAGDFGEAKSRPLSRLGQEYKHGQFIVAAQPMLYLATMRRFHERLWDKDHVLALLHHQLERGVSDPRDKIYGTLDMIDGWHGGRFSVDYNHTLPQVYTRAVHSLIHIMQSLDILTSIYARPVHTRLEGLPTWCPDWSDWPTSCDSNQLTDSEFSIAEHHLNQWGKNKFDASRKRARIQKFSACGKILTTYGIMVDILKDIVDSPFRALKPEDTAYSHENMERIIEITKAQNDSSQKETLWRTLVSNREWNLLDHRCECAPMDFGPRFDSWRFTQGISDNPELTKPYETSEWPQLAQDLLPADQQPDAGLSPKEISEYLRSWCFPYFNSCKAATRNRTFFLTEQDNMGLAPLHARPGDIAVVLYGCTLPVILRPIEGHFEFVGQAYIHGYMTGEAVDLAKKGELEKKWFEIH